MKKQVCLVAVMAAAAVPPAAPGEEPPRIVSFVPTATETAFAVGLGPYVVGRSRFCDVPPEAASARPVGDLATLSESAVAGLRPTHALVYRENAGQVPFLKALGVKIVECAANDVASALAVADLLGDTFPAFTNGFASGPWRARMEALASAPPPPPDAASALVAVSHPDGRWGDVFAAGGDTFYEQVLRAAGYSNVLSSAKGYPALDPGRVRALAPDIVFDLRPGAAPSPAEAEFWKGPAPDAKIAVIRDPAAVRPGPRLPDLPALFREAEGADFSCALRERSRTARPWPAP